MTRNRSCRNDSTGRPTRRSMMVGASAFAVVLAAERSVAAAAPSGPSSARQCRLKLAPGGWLLRADDPVSRPTA